MPTWADALCITVGYLASGTVFLWWALSQVRPERIRAPELAVDPRYLTTDSDHGGLI